jgi:hypothetical protein
VGQPSRLPMWAPPGKRDACPSAFASVPNQQGASPCRGDSAPCNRKKLRPSDGRWRASGGERPVRRMTNSIRPIVAASPLGRGEAQQTSSVTCSSGVRGQTASHDGTPEDSNQNRSLGRRRVVGDGMVGRFGT